jgi:RecA-family ATPase
MTFAYSLGRDKHDATPVQRTAASLEAFVADLDSHRAPKKDTAAYFCGPLNGDGKRTASGALPRRWLALDFDKIDADTLPELRLWLARFAGCAWPTHSSTREAPRERVILELDRDADRAEAMAVGETLAADLQQEFGAAIRLDPCTYRGEQPLFVPPTGVKLARFDGEPLAVDAYLAAQKGRAKASERPQSADQAEDDLLDRLTRGDDLHGVLRTLVGRMAAKGLDAETIRAAAVGLLERARQARGARVDQFAGAELERLISGALEKYAPTLELPRVLDLAALAKAEPAAPEFVVAGWLPCGEVALLAGHGGSGKSAIALYLAVCVALGRPFFGIPTQRRRVLFVSLEDGEAVLHWRLRRIAEWIGVSLEALREWLVLADGSHAEAELYTETKHGAALTHVYEWTAKQMEGREVLVLDGISDAYGADEIRRRHVRAFVRAVRRLVPATGAALLLGHIDKASAKLGDTSQGYSGSTAWNNSVRSRWYLRPEVESGELLLELQKSNYSPAGAQVRIRWLEHAHVFAGEVAMPAGKLERELAESDERESVLRHIAEAQAAGDPVPAATTGSRTSWSVLRQRTGFPPALAASTGKRRFWEHVEALRAAGRIRSAEHRTASRKCREVLHAC